MKRGETSNPVCVYVSGATKNKTCKLLGVPEVESGTGKIESEVVIGLLHKWEIDNQLVGLVFDTTSSNTGAYSGACKFIEESVGRPVLWGDLSCGVPVATIVMNYTSNMPWTLSGG